MTTTESSNPRVGSSSSYVNFQPKAGRLPPCLSEAVWFSSGSYAEGLVALSGRGQTVTNVASDFNSLWALVRRSIISVRRDQAEQQIGRLEAMRHEPAGWDGRNAAAPDTRTIDLASNLIRRFADCGLPIPTATMSPVGNAAFFNHAAGAYADIELHANGTVSWLIQLPSGPEIEDTERLDGGATALRLIDILKHAPGSVA